MLYKSFFEQNIFYPSAFGKSINLPRYLTSWPLKYIYVRIKDFLHHKDSAYLVAVTYASTTVICDLFPIEQYHTFV